MFQNFRCSGKVFEAEKMVAASGWYHRHCFRCSFCAQPVDSTSVCDGPDNKIYCRVCYKRLRYHYTVTFTVDQKSTYFRVPFPEVAPSQDSWTGPMWTLESFKLRTLKILVLDAMARFTRLKR